MKLLYITLPFFLDSVLPLLSELKKKVDLTLCIQIEGADIQGNVVRFDPTKIPVGFDVHNSYIEEKTKIIRSLSGLSGKIIFNRYESQTLLKRKNISIARNFCKSKYCCESDILNFNGDSSIFFLYGNLIKHKARVCTIHDPFPHIGEGQGYNIVKNYLYRLWALHKKKVAVITHSKYAQRQMSRAYPLCRLKVRTVYLGPYFDYARSSSISSESEEKRTILFYGRMSKYKGIDYLLKAVPLVRKKFSDLKVIVAGPGKFRNIDDLKNKKYYEIHNDFIDMKSASKLFHRATLIVLPYTDATQSGVLMVAYAFKKPVIASNIGGLAEIIEDGVTGLLVKPACAESLARSICSMLGDDQKQIAMKMAIENIVHKKYSWERSATETFSIYRDLLCA